ncbi:MAG: hypothetical protein KGP27_09315 [Hyphomicrobiales bacterium]|nr:hypothetical protein [Hyphomicrobiales bacterium]
MTARRTLLVGVLGVVLAGLFQAASAPFCPAGAQGSETCSSSCKAAYGACYKSTANRTACEAQLQRCLQGCLSTRGG